MGRRAKAYPWTRELDSLLVSLKRQNKRWREISHVIGFPPTTCMAHYYVLYHQRSEVELIEPKKPQPKRPCLRCRKVKVIGWSYCTSCRKTLHLYDTPFSE